MSADGAPAPKVSAEVLPGIGEVVAGTDLAAVLLAAAHAGGVEIGDDDVLVVASKVVAKAQGRSAPAADRESAIDRESLHEVASRVLPQGGVTRVVHTRTGPVLAAAGIDASDVPDGTVLLLPADPDASARSLRAGIARHAGVRPAVVVSDTSGRPWREGVTDFALGAAGLEVLDDLRGTVDASGRTLLVTVRAVADEVAALGDLVKGKSAGTPVAVVRGLGRYVTTDDGPGAAACVRVGPTDWFRHGHVEAVRAALGSAVVAPPALDPATEPVGVRLARALEVALSDQVLQAAVSPVSEELASADDWHVQLTGPPYEVGRAGARLEPAAWSEDLTVQLVSGPVRRQESQVESVTYRIGPLSSRSPVHEPLGRVDR
jgi:coenzyme F420-0:L-glutamate ligase/coenzyme F420-1:gamma-L-glutamate ligase